MISNCLLTLQGLNQNAYSSLILTLPEWQENDRFDCTELQYWLVRTQEVLGTKVKQEQSIQRQTDGCVVNQGHIQVSWIRSEKIKQFIINLSRQLMYMMYKHQQNIGIVFMKFMLKQHTQTDGDVLFWLFLLKKSNKRSKFCFWFCLFNEFGFGQL